MKCRNGYVSNSSSSSFVVAIDDPREELRELRKKKLLELHEKILNQSCDNIVDNSTND